MTFRVFVPLCVLFFSFLYFSLLNRAEVAFFYGSARSVNLPLATLLMAAFVAGAAGLAVVNLFGSLGDLLSGIDESLARWKTARARSGFARARELADRGAGPEALARLDKVLAAEPNNYDALMLKGDLLRKTGPSAALGPHSLALAQKRTGPEAVLAVAGDYRAMGNIPAAMRCLALARGRSPENFALADALSSLHLETGDFAGAATLLKAFVETAKEDGPREAAKARLAEAATLGAEAMLAEGNADGALEQCALALSAAPDFLPAALLSARALALKGDAGASVERLRGIYGSTRNPAALVALDAAVHAASGPAESARVVAAAAPNDPLASLLAALRMMDANDADGALRAMDKLPADVASLPVCLLAKEVLRLNAGAGPDTREIADIRTDLARERENMFRYRCGGCGADHASFFGQCPSCGAWNAAALFIDGLSPTALRARNFPFSR